MQPVRDEDDTTYLLLERSGEESRVRDPRTGEERTVDSDALEPLDDDALDVAAAGVPEAVRRVTRAAHSDTALGLLLDLHDHGPRSVREMLDTYDLCESDLHGLLAEFSVAGLLEEADVFGERGYALTPVGEAGVEALRE